MLNNPVNFPPHNLDTELDSRNLIIFSSNKTQFPQELEADLLSLMDSNLIHLLYAFKGLNGTRNPDKTLYLLLEIYTGRDLLYSWNLVSSKYVAVLIPNMTQKPDWKLWCQLGPGPCVESPEQITIHWDQITWIRTRRDLLTHE